MTICPHQQEAATCYRCIDARTAASRATAPTTICAGCQADVDDRQVQYTVGYRAGTVPVCSDCWSNPATTYICEDCTQSVLTTPSGPRTKCEACWIKTAGGVPIFKMPADAPVAGSVLTGNGWKAPTPTTKHPDSALGCWMCGNSGRPGLLVSVASGDGGLKVVFCQPCADIHAVGKCDSCVIAMADSVTYSDPIVGVTTICCKQCVYDGQAARLQARIAKAREIANPTQTPEATLAEIRDLITKDPFA